MATTSAAATIRLGVDLASLQTGLQQAATIADQKGQAIKAALIRATDSGVDGFKSMSSSIASALNPISMVTGALGSMATTIGAGVGAAGLGAMIAASISTAESMADLSIKTGVQVEQLSRFSSIAKLSGASMEDVAGIIKKLSISAVDAYSGNDKLARSFDAIGISTKELKSISPDDLLIRVAQGIQGIDPMVVQDLMAQLGGKSASNVLPFLRELTERIDETGVKISTQFAKDAKDFSDNITLLKSGVMALSNGMTSELLPSINAMLSGMVKGEPIIRSFMAAMAIDWNGGGLQAQLDQEKSDLKALTDSLTDNEDFIAYENHIKRRELRIKMLEERIGSTKSGINPEIDAAKTAAAARAAAANNKSGASAGDGFLQGLQARIEKADQGEYAMLRLQAAEKGVLEAAAPLIDQLKRLDEARAVESYRDALNDQNLELEYQASLIGKTATEVALLNVQHKAELELKKQIDQIERSKGAVSADALAQMQAAMEASIAIQQASVTSRIALENRWESGASKAFRTYQENAGNAAKGVENLFNNAFRGMEDALVQFAMTGKLNFTNLANGIIADIIRMQAQAAAAGMAKFLGQAIGSVFGATVSGTGYTSASPSGPGTYNYAGSEMTINTVNADGNVFSGAPSLSAYSNTVQTSPKFFNYGTLHRFANGGVFAEAGPEAVMPLTRMGNGKLGVASSGNGGVNISIYNQASQDTEVDQNVRKNDSGGYDIELFIRKVMMNDLGRNGPFTQGLASNFGLRRSA